jgi:glycosyltransferase involved in cell wall biosynthesis
VRRGHSVEWFSSSFPGAPSEEHIEGIRFVRAGRRWTVHWKAFRRYRGRLDGDFDLVIDEVNTIPFFTPLWAKKPRVMLVFQLAREVWWYESPFPLNAIGFVLEPLYLRFYRRGPVLTISQSTSNDLRKLGFCGSITVLPVGVEPVDQISVPKTDRPTFLYVGRLTASKRVGDIVRAFAMFEAEAGHGELWLIGDGPDPYESSLRALSARLGIAGRVRFWGRLGADEKHRKMAAAHALLMASVREGWGLVINEANACGTLTIAYDVPGLRDAVRDLETGLLVEPTPAAMKDAMILVWSDSKLRTDLSDRARRRSTAISYEMTADEADRSIGRTFTASDSLALQAVATTGDTLKT